MLTIHKQTVMVHPIIDEYYNYNPYHRRSSKFVQEKGLVTNEKGNAITPAATANDDHKKLSIATTLTPSMHGSLGDERPPLRPTNGNSAISPSDLRQLSGIPTNRDGFRPQEQGNTKKKRSSVVYQPQPIEPQEEPEPETPEPRAYGDPLKIAQYFPELT